MPFDQRQLELLVQCHSVGDVWPWLNVEMDSKEVENHVKNVIAQLRRKLSVKGKTQYDDYGSGYASFFDCWLYRETTEFRLSVDREHYVGLVVLFSRLSNYFVILEGDKSWDETTSGSYMPHFELVDVLEHEQSANSRNGQFPYSKAGGGKG